MAEQLLSLRAAELPRDANQRRNLSGGVVAAIALHVIVLAALVWVAQRPPVRVAVAHEGSIAAYVNVAPAPAGTTGVARPPEKPRVIKAAEPSAVPPDEPVSNESPGANAGGATGATQGATGPVRIQTGDVQLVRKVEPVYPPLMVTAGREGTVVLDAVINPDGSIGDVMVLQSISSLFDRAAVDAVKQWRYSPPGFQAIVTVTVIFSIR
jgi:TonB family protein